MVMTTEMMKTEACWIQHGKSNRKRFVFLSHDATNGIME